jgi:hypothetical protein
MAIGVLLALAHGAIWMPVFLGWPFEDRMRAGLALIPTLHVLDLPADLIVPLVFAWLPDLISDVGGTLRALFVLGTVQWFLIGWWSVTPIQRLVRGLRRRDVEPTVTAQHRGPL